MAATKDEARQVFAAKYGAGSPVEEIHLTQDEDCLDTWFSSWLWPFEVFKGYSDPENAEIKYYYPTNTLVTAPEIIFFWVARMIMAGFEYKNEKPFSEVYFTGIVRDKQGRKMSKSLGNSPDLLALIDKYGADATRFGIMISSPAGNDLLWDESSNEQGLYFNNKIWNALKLLKSWEARVDDSTPACTNTFATDWFENRLNEARIEIDAMFREFRLSEALKTIYSLVWDDFCSWYLEWVKPGFGQAVSKVVYERTVDFFGQLMELLHPFMPFITEDIYHQLRPRETDLIVKLYTPTGAVDPSLSAKGNLLKEIISAIRDARNKNQLKPKDPVKLHVQTDDPAIYEELKDVLLKQVNGSGLSFGTSPAANSITVVVQKDKFFLETSTVLDNTSQLEQLRKDLDYLKGFLASVEKKLGNERFVQNAKPEVIDIERRKKADAEAKIKVIEDSLGNK